MATPRQLAANRRNAKRSTGPRTAKGKATSSQNAVKHGILAETLAVSGLESPEDWEAFRTGLLESLKPVGALEELLAQKFVAAAWRLTRAERYERDIIDARVEVTRIWSAGSEEADVSSMTDEGSTMAPSLRGGQLPELDVLMHLTRYCAFLHKQMMQSLHELQRVQAARLGTASNVPVAIDVTVSEDAGTN
jgi:hypothetical protein